MLQPFFATAMLAPGRHLTFRRTAGLHALAVTVFAWAIAQTPTPATVTVVGYLVLILGMVLGATLIGWRLTQLPKSQALEFLLVSPVQPRRVFVAELLVGVCRFGLVCLTGLPAWLGLIATELIEPGDLWVLSVMPFVWGVVAGVGLTAWAYEPVWVRRIGEFLGLLGVLTYLVVGILAGENLRLWLQKLPPALGDGLFSLVMTLHDGNPFGVVRNWFSPDRVPALEWQRFWALHLITVTALSLLVFRAAGRLKGHFHDRHYKPITSDRIAQTEQIGDRPLSWWAVRRVMEFSGRVNVWLAGGFSLLYAAYLVADDRWPPWMGRLVFQLFENWGGAPMLATAMCVLAAVPAAFQFGLWDPTVSDRCRRLELLLLTDLHGQDYWYASLAAAWKRGRDYLVIAGVLWIALGLAGRAAWIEVAAAAIGGFGLWGFSFAVGFRAFSTGHQASGIASLLTLGLPLLLFALVRNGLNTGAYFVPTGVCYLPLRTGLTPSWIAGLCVMMGITWWLTRQGLIRCESELRRWYDANQGRKTD